MDYVLRNGNVDDIDYVKNAKVNSILSYDQDISEEDKIRILNYIDSHISDDIEKYKMILIQDKVIGCFLIRNENDTVLLDEVYLDSEYRGKGIGTKIIKDIIDNNHKVSLWVYKNNIKAISLYQRLNFKIDKEDEKRYYMIYSK